MNPPSEASALEERIILALETAPRRRSRLISPPRLRQLPPRPTVVLTPGRYGQRAAVACLVVLLALMLAFAHRATGTSLYWFSIESIFCAQFAVLAVWLVARNVRLYFLKPFRKADGDQDYPHRSPLCDVNAAATFAGTAKAKRPTRLNCARPPSRRPKPCSAWSMRACAQPFAAAATAMKTSWSTTRAGRSWI